MASRWGEGLVGRLAGGRSRRPGSGRAPRGCGALHVIWRGPLCSASGSVTVVEVWWGLVAERREEVGRARCGGMLADRLGPVCGWGGALGL